MQDDRDTGKVVYRGEGPYPHSCDWCGNAIDEREPYVLKADGTVMHEVCDFFSREDSLLK